MTSRSSYAHLLAIVTSGGLSFSAALLAPALPAQDIVLQNLANTPRKQWVDVALPAVDAALLPAQCRFAPAGWLAYKGSAIGEHSVLFHILADFAPLQQVTGSLLPTANAPATFQPWSMSDWVGDNTAGLVPIPTLIDNAGVEHRLANPQIELVENASPARRVFHVWGRLGTSPITYDAYAYLYVGQDVVQLEASFACSDPAMSGMSYSFAGLWVETGEYLQLDYRNRLGLPQPFVQTQAPGHPSQGKWIQTVTGPRTLGRGEGLHLQGSMLCLAEPGNAIVPTSYVTNGLGQQWSVQDRVDELVAEFFFPCVGVWRHWEDKWLAFGMVPELPIPFRADNGLQYSNSSWGSFLSMLTQPADLFSQRPRGLFKNASSTGAQEDFGAAKGSQAVTIGDPRWIYDAGYSVAETMMRGFHYRESDGRPMRKANHPGLQCFNQLPNCRTTLDTLGFFCPLPYQWPTTGWTVWDDQHRSQNNFNALLALTGSWALRHQLRDLAEVDKSLVPNWMDTPRAEGRLLMAWSNMYLLLDAPAERAALRATMMQRLATIQTRWRGAPFVNDPTKPIRALDIGSDGTFLEQSGERVPAIIVWEHSIAVMGFFAAWRVTGEQGFLDMAREISRLIVNYCIFFENNRWVAATAVRYQERFREGEALPASAYYTGSPDVHVGISFWVWIMPSVLIGREIWTGLDPQLVARCNAILNDQIPNGPSNWLDSEWWAVLPR
jgi:hypothetical protein